MKVFTCVKIAHTHCTPRSNEQTMRKPEKKTNNDVDVADDVVDERLGTINNCFIFKKIIIIQTVCLWCIKIEIAVRFSFSFQWKFRQLKHAERIAKYGETKEYNKLELLSVLDSAHHTAATDTARAIPIQWLSLLRRRIGRSNCWHRLWGWLVRNWLWLRVRLSTILLISWLWLQLPQLRVWRRLWLS